MDFDYTLDAELNELFALRNSSGEAWHKYYDKLSERRFDEYCFPGQCGLCRFSFVHNNRAVAVSNTGETSIALRLYFRPNYGTSMEPSHGAHGHYQTHPETCNAEEDKKAIACHLDCLQLSSSVPRQDVLKALSHSFDSPGAERRERRQRLQSNLAPHLAETWPILPYELCHHIAGYLVGEYSVALADAAWKNRKSTSTSITMNKAITATSTYFEGIEYITSLKNVADGEESEGKIVYDPKVHQQIDALYIQENCLGICKVIFVCLGDQTPTMRKAPGLWWKAMDIPNTDVELRAESDGMKLRSIVKPCNMSANEEMAFDEPRCLERTHLRHYPLRHSSRPNFSPSRMECLELNAPGIIGYSIRWTPSSGPTVFHAHRGRDDIAVYSTPDESDITGSGTYFWLYFPIQPGERMTELHRRMSVTPHRRGGREGTALAIVTNRDRLWFVGYEYASSRRQSVHWNLMELPPQNGTISTAFLDMKPNVGLVAMAFDSPTPNIKGLQQRFDQLPRQICIKKSGRSKGLCMSTSASLENVVALIPCYSKHDDRPPMIMGIIFAYADGCQECIGSVRLDRLGDPIRIDSTQNMWLGFGRVPYGIPSYLFSIKFSPPTHAERNGAMEWFPFDTMKWFEINSWTGQLHWLIFEGESHLQHDDRLVSPPVWFEEGTRNGNK